jgi:phosphoribosylformimino-5-aminoimidazole carboxamide ribotide isomerase
VTPRLWPAIDLSEGRVVRLLQGDAGQLRTYNVDPVELARRYEAEGADGLHLVDLDAAFSRGENRALVLSIVKALKIPVELGGGIRSRAAVDAALHDGVHRVVIGSLPFTQPELFAELVAARAPQIVAALDCLDGRPRSLGWLADAGGDVDAAGAAETFGALGVRALLVTDVSKDGMLTGPNLDLLRSVRGTFSGEILASGGVRGVADVPLIASALDGGDAGIILGRALLEGFVSVAELKERRDEAFGLDLDALGDAR